MTTNFAEASYQEVIDLNTESDTVSVIGLHTPCTSTPVDMLQGFWTQFRKVRYDGCSFALVPAARLPVDPLGVSYEGGESQIDPRDLLNPILFHGCHGNDMGYILNSLYHGPAGTPATAGWNSGALEVNGGVSDSTEQTLLNAKFSDMMEALYYKAMTDNTWKKAHPMAGMKKSGLRPMVHDLAINIPLGVGKHESLVFSDGVVGRQAGYSPVHLNGSGQTNQIQTSDVGAYPQSETAGRVESNLYSPALPEFDVGFGGTASSAYPLMGSTSNGVQFMTNRLRSLGWLDTSSPVARVYGQGEAQSSIAKALDGVGDMINTAANEQIEVNTIPKVFMGMIMLPPAYKTEQYYRLVINHHFSFKGFRGISMRSEYNELGYAYGYTNNMRNIA